MTVRQSLGMVVPRDRVASLHPGRHHRPRDGQNDGAEEQTDNAVSNRAADDADHDYRHGRGQPARHQKRPEEVVYQTDRDHVGGEDRGLRRFHFHPAPDNDWYNQDARSDLDNTQQQSSECEHARSRNASGQETCSGEKCLQERDADYAARYVAYGCARQLHQFLAAVTEDSTQESAQSIDQLGSSGEQEPRYQDRDDELNQAEERALGDVEQLGADRL